MQRINLDYETFSGVDIKKTTTYRYAEDHSTEILMCAYSIDGGDIRLWEPHKESPPGDLIAALKDANVIKRAFNANFERQITKYKLGIDVPIQQWECTQVLALSMGFPAKLDDVLGAVGLGKKDPRGQKLINHFSKPAPKNHKADRYTWENSPEEWQEFCEYCVRDVDIEMSLRTWLDQFPRNMDWQDWYLDQTINERGIPFDVEMGEGAVQVIKLEKERIKQRLTQITGLKSPTRGPMLEWMAGRGLFLPNTQRDTLEKVLLHEDLAGEVGEVLSLWTAYQSRSADKFKSALLGEQEGVIRGVFQMMGAARTGRWAGRLIQPHNLKSTVVGGDTADEKAALVEKLSQQVIHVDLEGLRSWGELQVPELVGSAVRHAIKSPPGYLFAVCDWSSIESRILGWLTHCQLIIQTFAAGHDTYKVFAARYNAVPYDHVTKAQRKFAKPPTLGCGYQLGAEGLVAYADGYGVALDIEEAQRAVDTFREMYHDIPIFWKWINEAVMYVTAYNQEIEGYRLRVYRDSHFLYIRLPSGRRLHYYLPLLREHETKWGEMKWTFSYMGVDQKTNQWRRIYSYGGKLTENIVQATAADILKEGLRAISASLPVRLHVHDEILVETPQQDAYSALAFMQKVMSQSPLWAQDLQLGAEGYVAQRYRKD